MSWVSFLIRCDSEPQWPLDPWLGSPATPWNWIPAQDANHYLMAERPRFDQSDNPLPAEILDDPAVQAVNGYQIGGWNTLSGDPHGSIDNSAYEAIRPLGNYPERIIYDEDGNPVDVIEAGEATRHLRYQNFAGSKQVKLGNPQNADRTMQLYPASNAPYLIEMRFKDFGGTWGWRCEVVGGVASRNISSRQMRSLSGGPVYPFNPRQSEWFTDEDGNPIDTWASENDEGWSNKQDVELAVRYQGKNEGYFKLGASEERSARHFWVNTQPSQDPAVSYATQALSTGAGKTIDDDEQLKKSEETKVMKALVDLGFDENQLQVCDPMNGGVTPKQVVLRLIQCIRDGVLSLP